MAERGNPSFDVMNTLISEEVKLLNRTCDLLTQERKDIDRLRLQRYKAADELQVLKERLMEVDFDSKGNTELQVKVDILSTIEANLIRKQRYGELLSEIIQDRKINIEQLSSKTVDVIGEEIADLKF